MRLGVAGAEADRVSICRRRLRQSPQPFQRRAEVVVQLRDVPLDSQRLHQMGNGVGMLSGVAEHGGEVDAELRHLRRGRHGTPHELDRLVAPPAPPRQPRQKTESLWVVDMGAEVLAADGIGLFHSARLKKLEGVPQAHATESITRL